MKKIINKSSTYAFWVGLSSAIVVLVESIGKMFGFEVMGDVIEEFIMSVCGVLVVLGFVTKDKTIDDKSDSHDKKDIQEDKDIDA